MSPRPQDRWFAAHALLLMMSIYSAPANAAPKSDTPADYAYAIPLQLSGKQGVVSLRLPQVVYLQTRTADLDDLRVFDAKGVAQSHALYRPEPATPVEPESVKATLFPIRSPALSAPGAPPIELDVQTRADGSIRSVRARTGAPTSTAALTGLVLDFGPPAKASTGSAARIEALRFGRPAGRPSYSAEVWLETSDDLKRWQTVGAAELVWLSNDTAQTLANDRLEFTAQSFRYARLVWRRGEPTVFPSIEAELLPRQSREPERETLWIKPLAGRQPGDLVYPAGIALPVEQISVKLSEENIVYPVALGYYVERPSGNLSRQSDWRFQALAQATFFQITQNGQLRRSGALPLVGGHRTEWVIRPQNAASTTRPLLGLSWQPATLVFLAGGTAPYALAFGRGDATPASRRLAEVAPGFSVGELGQIEQAQIGELLSNGPTSGQDAGTPAILSARNRSLVLWAVLMLGVAVLGGLVWRLIRQMKRDAVTEKAPQE